MTDTPGSTPPTEPSRPDPRRRFRDESEYRRIELALRVAWLALATVALIEALPLLWDYDLFVQSERAHAGDLARIETKIDAVLRADQRTAAPPYKILPGVPDSKTLPAAAYLLKQLDTQPKGSTLHAVDLLDLLKPLEDLGVTTKDDGRKLVKSLFGDLNEIGVEAAKDAIKKLIEGADKKETAAGEGQTQSQFQLCMPPLPTNSLGATPGPTHVPRHHQRRHGVSCPVAAAANTAPSN